MEKDFLSRGKFLDVLSSNIDALAAIPEYKLATPRVLAVDAPWGNGKTWIARQLAERLRAASRSVAVIDVFRYDHHDDAFAVIAASIFETLKPSGEKKRKLLSAAGEILKTGVPAATKVILTVGANAIGLGGTSEAFVEALKDGASSISGKAVESLFKTYSSTEATQRDFIDSLAKITVDLPQPLVVIVDELDRCRPSFALEVLERIKHLFDAPNVVFVMFWNSASIHESIRHTYGTNTNAEAYLSKFIAFSAHLTLPPARSDSIGSMYTTYITGMATTYFSSVEESFEFREAMRTACQILEPKLREIQRAMQLAAQTNANINGWHSFVSYLILLKCIDDGRFLKVVNCDSNALLREAQLFSVYRKFNDNWVEIIYCTLKYLAAEEKYGALAKRLQHRVIADEPSLSGEEKEVLVATNGGEYVRFFKQACQTVMSLRKHTTGE